MKSHVGFIPHRLYFNAVSIEATIIAVKAILTFYVNFYCLLVRACLGGYYIQISKIPSHIFVCLFGCLFIIGMLVRVFACLNTQ